MLQMKPTPFLHEVYSDFNGISDMSNVKVMDSFPYIIDNCDFRWFYLQKNQRVSWIESEFNWCQKRVAHVKKWSSVSVVRWCHHKNDSQFCACILQQFGKRTFDQLHPGKYWSFVQWGEQNELDIDCVWSNSNRSSHLQPGPQDANVANESVG